MREMPSWFETPGSPPWVEPGNTPDLRDGLYHSDGLGSVRPQATIGSHPSTKEVWSLPTSERSDGSATTDLIRPDSTPDRKVNSWWRGRDPGTYDTFPGSSGTFLTHASKAQPPLPGASVLHAKVTDTWTRNSIAIIDYGGDGAVPLPARVDINTFKELDEGRPAQAAASVRETASSASAASGAIARADLQLRGRLEGVAQEHRDLQVICPSQRQHPQDTHREVSSKSALIATAGVAGALRA